VNVTIIKKVICISEWNYKALINLRDIEKF